MKEIKNPKVVYGPVDSWRLNKSLGIDPICSKKICSYNCIYCQYGETTKKTIKRKNYIEPTELKNQLLQLDNSLKIDNVTFAGTGEPTLARNLENLLKTTKNTINKPIAILTNSSLFPRKRVRKTLLGFDKIIAKIDAFNSQSFRAINDPHPKINYKKVIKAIKKIRKEHDGFFAIQTMLTQKNKNKAKKIAEVINEINKDELQLNTPLRKSKATPLSQKELKKAESFFCGKIKNVYEEKKPYQQNRNDRKIS